MGRSKNQKRKHQQQQQAKNNGGKSKNKRRKNIQQFWILDCQATKESDDNEGDLGSIADIELLVTRVELTDDHQKANLQSRATGNEKSLAKKDQTENTEENLESATGGDNVEAVIPILTLIPPTGDISGSASACNTTTDPEGETEDTIGLSIKVSIRKANSAKRPIEKCGDYVDNFKPRPNGDCGDGILNPHPKDQVPDKYWAQRRRLFSRFDEGIRLDKESWYSVTPEAIANHIASHLVGSMDEAIVLDLFCGCGGNAVAFALRKEVKQVICVDKDVEKLKKARWNASIYGVQNKLLLVHANALDVLANYVDGKLEPSKQAASPENDGLSLPPAIDTIFLSPPWGGMDYGNVGKHGYNLACIKIQTETGGEGSCCDGEELLQQATRALGLKSIAYFLPKNINGDFFAKSAHRAGYRSPIVMEQNVLNGKLKTVTAYLGLGS